VYTAVENTNCWKTTSVRYLRISITQKLPSRTKTDLSRCPA